MGVEVSFIAAFLAGVLSISSPCVLPLVPIFLAHLAGTSAGGVAGIDRRRVLPNAVAYVLGFSLVFIALGVALGAAGALASTASVVASNRDWLTRIGGAMLIVLGLHQIGIVRIPLLDRERRLAADHLPAGQVTSSFLVGVTFAAGWSPCVGPILGAILTMAAGQGSIDRAALLLATYSAGLAVPFLAGGRRHRLGAQHHPRHQPAAAPGDRGQRWGHGGDGRDHDAWHLPAVLRAAGCALAVDPWEPAL